MDSKTTEKRQFNLVGDFSKATYMQLEQIVYAEDCELIYKCVAQAEMEKRKYLVNSFANYMRKLILAKNLVH